MIQRILFTLQGFIGGTARVVVASAVALTLLVRRDPATYLWVAGGILNASVSKVLKRLINESRPVGARTADPGMPSSHAMSLFFLSVFVAAAAQDWKPSVESGCPSIVAAWHQPYELCVLCCMRLRQARGESALVTTKDQIAVGAVLGAANGFGWYPSAKHISGKHLRIYSQQLLPAQAYARHLRDCGSPGGGCVRSGLCREAHQNLVEEGSRAHSIGDGKLLV